MSGESRIVAVTCLALEARIAVGPGVVVICNQGPDLIASLERAVERGAHGIISFGVAGGLGPGLQAGHWVVGRSVRTHHERFVADELWSEKLKELLPGAVLGEILGVDAPVASSSEKRRLHQQTGALAVDMESHIAARIATANRLRLAACRVIIDAAHRDLPPAALIKLRRDGTPDVGAVCRSVAQDPGQFAALVRTALDAQTAGAALRRGRRLLGRSLSYPHSDEVSVVDIQATVDGKDIGLSPA